MAILFGLISSSAQASKSSGRLTCDQDSKRQKELSDELRALAAQDQADRALPFDKTNWTKVGPRDLRRRIRVSAIFAEGCFKDSSDYASAALVFQHGTTADHFYQAFLWASRSVALGDESQRWLAAAALDRYLVKMGRKQLFGTQFGRAGAGPWCIQPVEPTFPDKLRREFINRSLDDNIDQFLLGSNLNLKREDIRECQPDLAASPRGSVPGFW